MSLFRVVARPSLRAYLVTNENRMVFALLINFLPRSEVDRARETPAKVSAGSGHWVPCTDPLELCDRITSAETIVSKKVLLVIREISGHPTIHFQNPSSHFWDARFPLHRVSAWSRLIRHVEVL